MLKSKPEFQDFLLVKRPFGEPAAQARRKARSEVLSEPDQGPITGVVEVRSAIRGGHGSTSGASTMVPRSSCSHTSRWPFLHRREAREGQCRRPDQRPPGVDGRLHPLAEFGIRAGGDRQLCPHDGDVVPGQLIEHPQQVRVDCRGSS